jgi:hypothetical protein
MFEHLPEVLFTVRRVLSLVRTGTVVLAVSLVVFSLD